MIEWRQCWGKGKKRGEKGRKLKRKWEEKVKKN